MALKDKMKKKPTKTEFEVEQQRGQIQFIYQILGDIDRRLTALSRAKVDAKVFAKFILDGKANQEFMNIVNSEIDSEMKIQDQKNIAPKE